MRVTVGVGAISAEAPRLIAGPLACLDLGITQARPDARLSDKYGIILGAALEDLYRSTNFIVTSDDRIELPLLSLGREIDRVLLQRLTGVFCVGIIHMSTSTNFIDCFLKCTLHDTSLLKHTTETPVVQTRG